MLAPPLPSSSFIVFGGGVSWSSPATDEPRVSVQLVPPAVDSFVSRQTDSITVENLLLSVVHLFPPPPPHPPKNRAACQHLLIAMLRDITGTLETVLLQNNLAPLTWSFKMQNYRPDAKRGPRRPSASVLIVLSSAVPDVRGWQYNYRGVGRDKRRCCLLVLPLNIQLHCTGSSGTRGRRPDGRSAVCPVSARTSDT